MTGACFVDQYLGCKTWKHQKERRSENDSEWRGDTSSDAESKRLSGVLEHMYTPRGTRIKGAKLKL